MSPHLASEPCPGTVAAVSSSHALHTTLAQGFVLCSSVPGCPTKLL